MGHREIHSALSQHLNSVNNLPAIYWRGVENSTTKDTPFIVPTFVPFASQMAEYGREHSNTGIFQVAIYYPLGQGIGPVYEVADSIYRHFNDYSSIREGATEVYIENISIGEVEKDGAWHRCSVNIEYENIE